MGEKEALDQIVGMRAGEGAALAAIEGDSPATKQVVLSERQRHSDLCDGNAAVGAIPLDQAYPSGHMKAPFHDGCNCQEIISGRRVAAEEAGAEKKER